jgi:hypothetical protein
MENLPSPLDLKEACLKWVHLSRISALRGKYYYKAGATLVRRLCLESANEAMDIIV